MKPQARRRPLAPVPPDARQYPVPMRDGVLMATDVYLPAPEGRFDVVLSRLPYDKDGDEFFMPAIARYWVSLGYAVVVQDVRGKGRSGGEFQPESWDVLDAYDTIDWIVHQGWSRGRVAMVGDSFAGYTQWAAAASGHPALVAITPRCASHDRTDQRFDGGVLSLEVSVYWAAETAIDEYLYDYPEPFDWSVRPVREVLTREVGYRRPRWIDGWAGVEPTAARPRPPVIPGGLPALHLCGLYDHSIAAEFRSWQLARSAHPRQYLVLDSVDHSWRGLRTPGSDSMVLEPESEFLQRYFEHVHEFVRAAFSASSYGHDLVCWRPALDVPWREAPSWPPPGAVKHTLWATRPLSAAGAGGTDDSGGGLVPEQPPSQPAVTWTHDPRNPVPSRGHAFHELAERADLSDLAGRPDLVEFHTDPLAETLELAGVATFAVDVTSSAQSTLVVTLLDVTPDGRTWEVRTGRARIAAAQPASVSVNLGPVAYVYLPGHRLGVRISSSLFPRLALDSGNESNTWREWTPTTTRQSIAVGGVGGARLSCAVWVTQ